ncbi:MAG: hypothetical protein II840_13015 [Kiritimatiellae bacterium]|nr:hypothetical protein [Kiritimatiellia bacterium]
MSDVDDKVEAFINAEGDAVLDAFLALLPTEDENYKVANSQNPAKFIAKLHDIDSSARTILNAASDYAGAKLVRMRCEKRRIPRKRIQRVDQNLLEIYDLENDALDEQPLKPEKEKERGRKLLNACSKRAETIVVPEVTFDSSIAKGELHCLANGEGYERREISWKRT